jgi:hypothetical protein
MAKAYYDAWLTTSWQYRAIVERSDDREQERSFDECAALSGFVLIG